MIIDVANFIYKMIKLSNEFLNTIT